MVPPTSLISFSLVPFFLFSFIGCSLETLLCFVALPLSYFFSFVSPYHRTKQGFVLFHI